ncbi:hypothetical protein DSO57_1009743 [Entomophthora muscae]|uniref:Uncharacterized protein n=1 Tax=Entomophthora muscae TaxID=34485 RepID=A0ACC2URI4_9FUNG|nr:hypothetical protein DSO57_1009743 [Entomophthora muscae]
MKLADAAVTMSTQLFEVLYITLTGFFDSMVPNSGPWSLLRWSLSYFIKLAPILWWELPTGPEVLCPESSNASTYAWLPGTGALKGIKKYSTSRYSQAQKGWETGIVLLYPYS